MHTHNVRDIVLVSKLLDPMRQEVSLTIQVGQLVVEVALLDGQILAFIRQLRDACLEVAHAAKVLEPVFEGRLLGGVRLAHDRRVDNVIFTIEGVQHVALVCLTNDLGVEVVIEMDIHCLDHRSLLLNTELLPLHFSHAVLTVEPLQVAVVVVTHGLVQWAIGGIHHILHVRELDATVQAPDALAILVRPVLAALVLAPSPIPVVDGQLEVGDVHIGLPELFASNVHLSGLRLRGSDLRLLEIVDAQFSDAPTLFLVLRNVLL